MILNLTQHATTPDQIEFGVVDLPEEQLITLRELLTFEDPPTMEEMEYRAEAIAVLAQNYHPEPEAEYPEVMIGGAPFFMSTLESVLNTVFTVLYAFSKRQVKEERQADGSVTKASVFKHVGFVEPRV